MLIPAINAQTFKEIEEKLELIKPYSEWAHIDVADGTFTKNVLWHNPKDLDEIRDIKIAVHLMIDDIDGKIANWLSHGIGRIIFHLKAAREPKEIIFKIRNSGAQAGISISPSESPEEALAFKNEVDFFQILAVEPGLPGQKIKENTFNRIKEVREACPSCIIEVDGGMDKETIPLAIGAGANRIVAASAIFGEGKVEDNIKSLNELCRT